MSSLAGRSTRPRPPTRITCPRADTFSGLVLNGTTWFERSYDGERVAVLASGSEAALIVPEVLRTAVAVTVFEESACWITPVPVPCSALGRVVAKGYLRIAITDSWTRQQLTPHPEFDRSRPVVRPNYYAALRDQRCRLLTWPTYAIVEHGVRAADGVEYRVDTIVVGATSKFATLIEGSNQRKAHQ